MTRAHILELACVALLGSCGLACAGHPDSVPRVVDGRLTEGRFVSHVSYTAYARAAELEARAEFGPAEAAYLEALRFDPKSPQIWTRLGSVRCVSGRQGAQTAFDTAERLAPDFAALWYERAQCEFAHARLTTALEAARRTLALDPNHLLSTKLIADILAARGERAVAQRYLDALAVRHPELVAVQRWRTEFLTQVEGRREADRTTPSAASLELLDQALLANDFKKARQLALERGMSESEVAARTVALGNASRGLVQAQHVRAADPADGTAWVVELAAADLLGDEAAYKRALAAPEESPTEPSALGRLLLADLLKRRVGPDAARAWLKAAPETDADDPLLARHMSRLVRELETDKRATKSAKTGTTKRAKDSVTPGD